MPPTKKIALKTTAIISRTLLLLLVISGVYYFFWLLPDQQSVASLTELEKQTAEHYHNLLGHRLALTEMSHLSANSGELDREKEGILAHIDTYQESNSSLLTDELTFKPMRLFAFTDAGRLESSLLSGIDELREQHRELLKQQEPVINALNEFSSATGKLASYLPDYYLNQYNLPEEKDELANQLLNARQALLDIRVGIDRLPMQTEEIGLFSTKLDITADSMERIAESLQRLEVESTDEINRSKDEAIATLQNLRNEMIAAQNSILTSDDSLSALTAETNALLSYRHLMNHIDANQARLYTEYSSDK